MFKKIFQPMYLEQLCLVIKRVVWQLTKIYSHYTFGQECFKNNFILMNQHSRENAKNSIEKDFYELMNNTNFSYNWRNNLDNCPFVPIFDELQEMTYLKKYYSYFYSKVSSFVSSDLIRQEIEGKYSDSVMKLSKDDKYYKVKLSTIKTEKNECLEAAENFDKNN